MYTVNINVYGLALCSAHQDLQYACICANIAGNTSEICCENLQDLNALPETGLCGEDDAWGQCMQRECTLKETYSTFTF